MLWGWLRAELLSAGMDGIHLFDFPCLVTEMRDCTHVRFRGMEALGQEEVRSASLTNPDLLTGVCRASRPPCFARLFANHFPASRS